MQYLTFDKDNTNSFSINSDFLADYAHHINSFPYSISHGHKDYWEFTILTKGHLNNVINGVNHIYNPRTLFYNTTDDIHKLVSVEKDEEVYYCNFLVRVSKIKQLCDTLSPTFFEFLKNGKRDYFIPDSKIIEIDKILHRIHSLNVKEGEKYNNYLCSAILILLQHIFFLNIEKNESENHWVNILNKKMQSTEFLSYNVAQLCEELKCSRMHLNRLIKQNYNMTPHQFLLSYKLSYAHNLLLSTDMSTKQVFLAVGYDSFSSFSRNFKEKYGQTPYKFKQTHYL